MDVPEVKISVTWKITDSSSININDHLRSENTEHMQEVVRKCNNNNLLELLLFERLYSIRLSNSKYLVTSSIDFSICRQSFASLLTYCHLLLQNK